MSLNQTSSNKKSFKGELYVILSAVLFGLMPLVANIGYALGANAMTTAFLRFLLGALILFPLALHEPGGIRIEKSAHMKLFKISLSYGFTPVLLYASYQYVSTGLATTLHFIYPVVVILILFLVYREKITKRQIACTLLCMAGMLLLEGEGGSSALFGLILAAGSGVTYAIYIVLIGKSGLKKLPLFTLTFWLSLYASLVSGVLTLLCGQMHLTMSWQAWGMELLLAFLATVLALVIFQKGLFLCGEVKASLLSTFEPLTGVFVGLTVFHETLGLKTVIGILLILLSTTLLVLPVGEKLRKRSSARRPSAEKN